MKFTIAAIFLAFVAFASAHVVVDHVSYGHHVGSHGPALVNTHGSHGGWGGYGGHGDDVGSPHGAPHITLHTTGWGYNGGYGGGDGAGAGDGGHGGHHGHDGTYVAQNRGAKHVAPLVGHIQSVKSTNEQPAPGTTW